MEIDKAFIEKIFQGKINLQESKYKKPENKSSILIKAKCEIKRISENDFQLIFMTSNNEIFRTQTISLFKDNVLTLDELGFTLTMQS